MIQTAARYEFRVFATDLTPFAKRLEILGKPCGQRQSDELYLLGSRADYNVKIREHRLEIKQRLAVEQGLERWCSRVKTAFPLAAEQLRKELYPALGLTDRQTLAQRRYGQAALLEELDAGGQILPVRVGKRRSDYSLGACQAEFVALSIECERWQSIAIESEEAGRVLALLPLLGLEERMNTNYPQAIASLYADKIR